LIYPEIKKRRNLLAIFAGEATLKVTVNSLFSNPLMPLTEEEWAL
jgi:hypothetical protein